MLTSESDFLLVLYSSNHVYLTHRFYSASAMQSAVLQLEGFRPSVRLRHCVQTNEDTIVRFSAFGKTILVVYGEVNFMRIFTGEHPRRGGVKVKYPLSIAKI